MAAPDLRTCLARLQLQGHLPVFEAGQITVAELPEPLAGPAGDDTLRALGLTSLGHRLRLKGAIRKLEQLPTQPAPLQPEQASAAPPPTPAPPTSCK